MREEDPFANANAKIENLENAAINEVKAGAQDVKNSKIDFSDGKPFIFKIFFLLGAFCNCFMGISLYFIFKDDEKHNWTTTYFLIGSVIGAVYQIVKYIFFS